MADCYPHVHDLRFLSPKFDVLICADQGVANIVLTVDNLPKAIEAYIKLKPVIGADSMITLEGEHWQKLRKMFNPAFAQGHLEKLVPGIVDETLNFVAILNEATKVDRDFLMLDALTVRDPLVLANMISYSRWISSDGMCT